STVNSPVLGPDGRMVSIIHRVEDVTEYVRFRQQGGRSAGEAGSIDGAFNHMEADILQRSRELQQLNEHLRVVQRVARIGSWQVEMHSNGRTAWSTETGGIFGVTNGSFGDDYQSFLGLVHPDDRPRLIEYG